MYFDPLSAWLVALIADGIMIVEEKSNVGTIAEFHRKNIEQNNRSLNAEIRCIKNRYSLNFAEQAYNQIKFQISVTKNSYFFKSAHGQIVIDLDNQEYIISLLEECAKNYYQYYKKYRKEEQRQKAEWFKNAAVEARRRKERYVKELEENRIKEAKEREKQQTMSNIYWVIGLVIFVAFITFFFS